jgi:hypothetical protein
LVTWSYFTFAHLTALMYALVVLHDAKSAWIFAGNLSFTSLLVALLIFKRVQQRHRVQALAAGDARRAKTEMRKLLKRAQSMARKDSKVLRIVQRPSALVSGQAKA